MTHPHHHPLHHPHHQLLSGPHGQIDWLTTGSGPPVTIFGHGLGASIAETRPLASGVPGTRVFLSFRGHGGSSAPDPETSPWTYAALAEELRTVADHAAATQALGLSMGSHALMSLVASTPDRFDRLVFVLPAALDGRSPSEHGAEMADLVDRRDVEGLARMLVAWQPEAVRDRPAVRLWARRHADALAGTPVATALRTMPEQVPLPDGVEPLRRVTAPALVIAQEGDPIHPVSAAERLAEVLPDARLEVLGPGGVLWEDRARLRDLLVSFLSQPWA